MTTTDALKEDLVLIGAFHDELRATIDRHFRCHRFESVQADERLRASVRGLLTRSNCRIEPAVLQALPALRVIATSGVGYDGIPVRQASERGIVVTNTPGVLDAAVCELGVGLLLALLRQIPQADRFVRDGQWASAPYPLTAGLAGKRVGIVGLGRIGRGMATRLAPFGVSLAYCGSRKPDCAYLHYPTVMDMAPQVDVMVLCCAGGTDTHHLINAEVLQALGAGYLVNMARGSVVDEGALLHALTRGTLRGAALDVFEVEPLDNPVLRSLPNVVLSPHAGSATTDTRQGMLQLALDNLHAVLSGDEPLSPVSA